MSVVTQVITVDGPSGVGKGTLCFKLAQHFGWPVLDSGAIYRALGYAAQQAKVDFDDYPSLVNLARDLPLSFSANPVSGEIEARLGNELIGQKIRTDEAGQAASQVAAIPEVRAALLQRQRDFAQPPGLVADGRDMGTVVFPSAQVKVFLTASAETRARRRCDQLKSKGIDASLSALLSSIQARDERDSTRSVAPLVAADDAFVLDTSNKSISEVFAQVLDYSKEKLGGAC